MAKLIHYIAFTLTASLSALTISCSTHKHESPRNDSLRCDLQHIADSADGKVGIALIAPDGDTITVNNDCDYQLMSVFKLHEALAVAHILDLQHTSLDTIISISRSELDSTTWSPMYKEHTEAEINLPVSELLRYILQESDNNVSNLLFDRLVSVEQCDSFIRATTGINDFRLTYAEHDMHANHSLANANHSTPMACAKLIRKVFTDSIVSSEKQQVIQQILLGCQTGTDRLLVPLAGEDGVSMAHKTGSGFRNPDGTLSAHNDVGYITLPDGRAYTLAVLVKDFKGDESAASAIIADISTLVYNTLKE